MFKHIAFFSKSVIMIYVMFGEGNYPKEETVTIFDIKSTHLFPSILTEILEILVFELLIRLISHAPD